MHYPSIEEVKRAGYDQLRQWFLELPPPGHYVEGSPDHATVQARELAVLELIIRKYDSIDHLRYKQAVKQWAA